MDALCFKPGLALGLACGRSMGDNPRRTTRKRSLSRKVAENLRDDGPELRLSGVDASPTATSSARPNGQSLNTDSPSDRPREAEPGWPEAPPECALRAVTVAEVAARQPAAESEWHAIAAGSSSEPESVK